FREGFELGGCGIEDLGADYIYFKFQLPLHKIAYGAEGQRLLMATRKV
nr:hypothetical protein [Tanacetum cinerariifolium]